MAAENGDKLKPQYLLSLFHLPSSPFQSLQGVKKDPGGVIAASLIGKTGNIPLLIDNAERANACK